MLSTRQRTSESDRAKVCWFSCPKKAEIEVLKTIKLPKSQSGPNVQKYKLTFGHSPSAEDMKWRSDAEREAMAAEALQRGEPVARWKNRAAMKLGTVTDGWYAQK